MLAAFGLAPVAGMNALNTLIPDNLWTRQIRKTKKNPVGNEDWKRIPQTNAMPETLRGLKHFLVTKQ